MSGSCARRRQRRVGGFRRAREGTSSLSDRVVRFPVERRQPRRLVDMRGLMELYGYGERWWRYGRAEGMPVYRWAARLGFDPVEVGAWPKERYGAG